jgi:hypothetical protein
MALAGIIASAVVVFEVIPMSTIPIVYVVVRQQEEHIIHPPIINTKEEEEHNIAIPFYITLSYLEGRKSTKQNSDAEKLSHLTFRTSESVIKELKREATSKSIPLSILLNNIVKNHLIQTNTEKADFIVISQDFFRRIFGKIDEKSFEDYGNELGLSVVNDYTASFFPEINGHTIIQFLEKWFSHFQSYQHRVDEGNSRHTFSLNHDINMNFSIVLKVILEGLIEPVIKNKVIFGETASNRITFTFDV